MKGLLLLLYDTQSTMYICKEKMNECEKYNEYLYKDKHEYLLSSTLS